MDIACIWEHHGPSTLLWARDYPGVCTRGPSLAAAQEKLPAALEAYCLWAGLRAPEAALPVIVQEKASELTISDADSDVLFDGERGPLSETEYRRLKALALRSAQEFLALFDSIPDPDRSALPVRSTFYGTKPRTAREMYEHVKNVNAYYFGEIGVAADNAGTICSCREAGFGLLETQPKFLENAVFSGSYGEDRTLKKVLRRFLWHDRIHAAAMQRMAWKTFGVRL